MGVERAVTRWYVQRQAIQDEIAHLEAKLAEQSTEGPEAKEGSGDAGAKNEIASQLAKARERLLILGPCPKPLMG